MRYVVHEITGQYAISFDDGQQLFDLIHARIVGGREAPSIHRGEERRPKRL
jgi:hypothetical protein